MSRSYSCLRIGERFWAPVPNGNSNWLTVSCESADNRSNERSLPIDLVRDGRTRPLAGSIASRNPNVVLRHQLNALRRKSPKRVAVGNIDRLPFVGLYRLDALKILKPETVLRWHRAGFRAYWRWKSRPCDGRPKTPVDIRQLIREMSVANPLWGAPRIHGELLKLGINVGQMTVAKYMAKRRRPLARLDNLPSQSCRRYRIDRPICRPDDFVSAVVCASGPAAFAAGAFVVGRYGTSKYRMDCPSTNRGLQLE
jgi:hypothetical protein